MVKILLYLIFLLGGDRAGRKGVCGRLMSPAQETQSMREIRLLRGKLPSKGGGLTGMDLQLHVQSVPITTKVVSSNPIHGEVYSIQHNVIKFVSDLRQVHGFRQVFQFHPSIKLAATI
jgi:hypothetical protein